MSAIQQPTSAQPGPLVDDPGIREVYADSFAGIAFSNGNLTLTFAVNRANHSVSPPTNERRVTDRVVIPINGAANLRDQITRVLNDLEEKGLIKKMPALKVVQ